MARRAGRHRPDRDVEITVSDRMLRINAQRRVEETTEGKGYTRHELRYGSFSRSLPLPPEIGRAPRRARG